MLPGAILEYLCVVCTSSINSGCNLMTKLGESAYTRAQIIVTVTVTINIKE
jgi:hypothetical protein